MEGTLSCPRKKSYSSQGESLTPLPVCVAQRPKTFTLFAGDRGSLDAYIQDLFFYMLH